MSSASRRKPARKEEEKAEEARDEQLKKERALGKAAIKSQTKPRRSRPD